MAMDGSGQWLSFPSSSSSQHDQQEVAAWSPPPPKCPTGRTKFKETRHPVYRGVRRRGRAGRWVCEVRVPGCKRGERLWLGTYLDAESAGRAHDAAMLMLRGAPAARLLNFPDSEWLLDVPLACPDSIPGVRRAAVAAVADFQLREAANGAAAAAAVPDHADEAASWTWATSHVVPRANNGVARRFDFEVPVAMGSSGMFELDDMSGEADVDMYYADLAEGLLMEPPPLSSPDAAGACWESGDYYGDAELWSCY